MISLIYIIVESIDEFISSVRFPYLCEEICQPTDGVSDCTASTQYDHILVL